MYETLIIYLITLILLTHLNRSWNVIVVSVRGKPVTWPDKEDKMLQELTKDYK